MLRTRSRHITGSSAKPPRKGYGHSLVCVSLSGPVCVGCGCFSHSISSVPSSPLLFLSFSSSFLSFFPVKPPSLFHPFLILFFLFSLNS